jgi:hypothetical protein
MFAPGAGQSRASLTYGNTVAKLPAALLCHGANAALRLIALGVAAGALVGV